MRFVLVFISILLVKLSQCYNDEEQLLNKTRVGNLCFIHYLNQIDLVEESNERSMPGRAFPLLNCSSFNEVEIVKLSLHFSSIHGFLLQQTNVSSFDLDDLGMFSNLETVEFRGNTRMTITPTTSNLTLQHVFSLTISDNGLTSIPIEILRTFPNLTHLALLRNNITNVEGDSFDVCKKLKSINLSYNPIKTHNTTWLDRTRNVLRLNLRSTGLKDISRSFKKAKYLRYLDLSDNEITRIERKSFGKASNLTSLILANNKISYISSRGFKGSINLRFLDLTENNLENLEEGTFQYSEVDDLTVELWENPFFCDCKIIWLKTWLENLSLYGRFPDVRLKCHNPSRNHGKKFISSHRSLLTSDDLTCRGDDTKWNGCPTCSEKTSEEESPIPTSTTSQSVATTADSGMCPDNCSCYSNKIEYPIHYARPPDNYEITFPLLFCDGSNHTRIPSSARSQTRGITMNNGIMEHFELTTLKPYMTIRLLQLSRNRIQTLIAAPDLIFQDLSVLSLDNNRITTLTPRFLSSFPSLRKLRIFNNQISELSYDLFRHNSDITKVFLGPNPLRHFDGSCLTNLTSLVNVALRGTGLTNVPAALKNKNSLLKLDLSDNNLTELKHDDFTNVISLIDVSLENNRIMDIEPRVFRNMTNLQNVDLSENRLPHLPPHIFSSNKYLHNVELWQNPIRCDCKIRWFIVWIQQMKKTDPSTEIRFRCEEPLRMRGKMSDQTNPEEYVCSKADEERNDETISNPDALYTRMDMFAAISTTILCTVVIVLVIIKLIAVCRSGGSGRNFIRRQYFKITTFNSNSPSHDARALSELDDVM